MLRAFGSAVSGMKSQMSYMDVVANNIANVNTTAYKSVRARADRPRLGRHDRGDQYRRHGHRDAAEARPDHLPQPLGPLARLEQPLDGELRIGLGDEGRHDEAGARLDPVRGAGRLKHGPG